MIRFGTVLLKQLKPGVTVRDNRSQKQITIQHVTQAESYPVQVTINGQHHYLAYNQVKDSVIKGLEIKELDLVTTQTGNRRISKQDRGSLG